MFRDPVLVYVSLLGFGALAVGLLAAVGKRVGVLTAVLGAFGMRLAFGLVALANGIESDAAAYDAEAIWIAGGWEDGSSPPALSLGKEGWPYILAVIYRFLGHAPELGVLLNAVAGGITVVLVAETCRRNDWSPARVPAAWIVALWPVGFVWGGLLLRESLVTLLLALALLGVAVVRSSNVVAGWAMLLSAGFAMVFMRGGLSLLILIAIPALLAAESILNSKAPLLARTAGLVGLLISGLLIWPRLNQYFEAARYFDPYRFDIVSRALNTGSTSFSTAGTSQSGFAPWNLLQTAFGPFPWQWANSALATAGIDALLWAVVWTFAVMSLWFVKDKWAALYGLLPAIMLVAHLSQSATNFGLIMRLRGLEIVFLAPLVAVTWTYLRRDRTTQSEEKQIVSDDTASAQASGLTA